MLRSSTVYGHRGQHDQIPYVWHSLLMHAAFVADEIWGFMPEPARIVFHLRAFRIEDFVVLDFMMSFFSRLFFSSILFAIFFLNTLGYVNANRSWYFTFYPFTIFGNISCSSWLENLKKISFDHSSIMSPKRGCSETSTYPQQNANGTHHFSGWLVVTGQRTYRWFVKIISNLHHHLRVEIAVFWVIFGCPNLVSFLPLTQK